MNKNRFLPGLICGFGAAVISFIPLINFLHCCRITPALAGFLGIFLLLKSQKGNFEFKLSTTDSIIIGSLIGLFSALFIASIQTIMIAIYSGNQITEAIKMMEKFFSNLQLPQFIFNIEQEISNNKFSFVLSLLIFMSEFIFNTIFAVIGALIGYSIFKKKNNQI